MGVVELIQATKQCEGQVVDKFPLRQYLGETDNSTVFLTEREGGQKAAIKFVPAEGNDATQQLAFWRRAAQLSHPHLLKIFEMGRCQLGGHNQVYIVLDYADENLSEILPERALTVGETTEMLGPLLDCLGYLHGSGLVHGHLRPGNIMAVDNQLELSSDGIRQAGEANPTGKKRNAYDPPEAGTATLSASADVWSLGITLVEVLTQKKPDWETAATEPVVPTSLPEPFREVARNCLRRDPNARWTVPQIKARLSAARPAPPHPEPVAPVAKARRGLMPVVIAILIVLAIVGAAALLRRRPANPLSGNAPLSPPKAEQIKERPAKPAAGQAEAEGNEQAGAATSQNDVVRQVLPQISSSAQKTIRGKIKLRVRVYVDRSGNVTRADLVSAGPSQYFARLIMEAARQWKFVPSSQQGERRWMLHFDLTRRGTNAYAQAIS